MSKNIRLPDGIKLILFTTIFIMGFMIIMPTLTIRSKVMGGNDEVKLNDGVVSDNKTDNVIKEISIDSSEKVKVYITSEKRIEEVDLEDYICGVVANEMPASFEPEALKAQAIAARTFLASKKIKNCPKADGAEICDSTHCQVYTSKEKTMEKWKEDVKDTYWNKIKAAVDATKGMVLSYNSELVLYPQFFATSSGKTENAVDTSWGDIPYLKSVDSPGEEIAPKFTSEIPIAIDKFVAVVNSKYPDSGVSTDNVESSINIISRSDAGGVKEMNVGNQTLTGADFRFLLGLNSTNFTYSFSGGNVVFNCKGYGHGVGMSQWGANVMAKNGSTYDQILTHYYTGVGITLLKFTK